MRRHLCCLGLVLSCTSETSTKHATALTLRVQASPSVQAAGETLLVQIAREGKDGFRARPPFRRDFSHIPAWPTDLPVEAEAGEDGKSHVQFVVSALDARGKELAQARALTTFVPHKQPLVEVVLDVCGQTELGQVCETRDECYGRECLTCVDGSCSETPFVRGDRLPTFESAAPIPVYEPATAATQDGDASDASGVEDVAEDEQPEAGPDDAELAAGLDAATQETGTAPGEGDAHSDVPSEAGDESEAGPIIDPECKAQERECVDDVLRSCLDGHFTFRRCEYACFEGECRGVCKPGSTSVQCSEATPLVPLVCDQRGEWAPNENAFDGEKGCKFLCVQGVCTGECTPETRRCLVNQPQSCARDGIWHDDISCSTFCSGMGCGRAPSCASGSSCASNESCCRSLDVPGGRFSRSYDHRDYNDPRFTATVSPLLVDRFEVTVSRFRAWLAVYDTLGATPSVGSGRNPHNPSDTGWQSAWNSLLPVGTAAFKTMLGGCAGATWTELSNTTLDTRPVNCLSWYEAQAFCIWDGGRLPTEAEWNFAAAGGDQQRVYPWSTPPDSQSIDVTRATYVEMSTIRSVGATSPAGDARWGHADMAGNVSEWVQDDYESEYREDVCVDCATLTPGSCRVIRGGNAGIGAESVTTSVRNCAEPPLHHASIGVRCVRNK